jgi:hypothetical protein
MSTATHVTEEVDRRVENTRSLEPVAHNGGMEHEVERSRSAWFVVVVLALALAAAFTSCGETSTKKQPDAGIDAPSGSASPCTLGSSKLDNCTL